MGSSNFMYPPYMQTSWGESMQMLYQKERIEPKKKTNPSNIALYTQIKQEIQTETAVKPLRNFNKSWLATSTKLEW